MLKKVLIILVVIISLIGVGKLLLNFYMKYPFGYLLLLFDVVLVDTNKLQIVFKYK